VAIGGLDTQPSATTYDLEDLVERAWAGQIRVPHSQRDFRWSSRDVRRLFESIVRGFPIGSLLIWVRKSPAQRIRLGSLEIDAPASDSALWVVDGQQRITSLANALDSAGNQNSPFRVSYNLATPGLDPKAWAKVLGSHLLDSQLVSLLRAGDRLRFLELRQEKIKSQLAEFVDSMAEWDYEDTPPLANLVLDDLYSDADG